MAQVVSVNLSRIRQSIIHHAGRVLMHGGVILYPTDTIYGLGCNALDEPAIKRIFLIKQREEAKPMLLLVRNLAMVRALVEEITPLARSLIKKHWPGPLTIIFKAKPQISKLLTARTGKIGVRLPKNNFCRQLIAFCNVPIVSTSANVSGQKSETDVDYISKQFSHRVDLVINGGILHSSPPSTVIDLSENTIVIVREGAIPGREISP
ncbi:MAG TPA: L-threonylcarbamoyladenylate synthase [Bacteroidota bacterium]|nr:L-threonylcarbamoyladenylate synthase [Bacteroidota bacterium]